ncbi:MAG: NAD-dependent epimerase/dehydratase [Candidatus Shapirobacteria bacterium GW2011_GWE1_38_10]|uniref:NAD-dependent epimerase/dehydratase n=1 Tax=Candidatus Shapirobacteria bacterium GW2011_GWE1_38_10 TaxID=1618488 RepID=A0A0G0L6N3_9BACT|nr:MAG: NAD-dependent epimerase/dehydratase [Candidatus Shapirobacteria bacterium GW2011_GWE1_38_10]
MNPQNPYAISKVANWFLARQYTKSFGFDIVYVTPFNHTGPGQGAGFLAPDVANQIVEAENGIRDPVIFTGDLSARRDFSDVRDIVRAYRLLIEKAKAGERFVISSGHSIPVKDVVDTLLSLAKVRIEHRIDPKRNRPLDIADLYGSHDKLTQVTGWEPEIPLEKTLSDLLDWYRGQE